MWISHLLLGTPETSLRGRSTLKALNAFTSNPSFIRNINTVLIMLKIVIRQHCEYYFAKLFFSFIIKIIVLQKLYDHYVVYKYFLKQYVAYLCLAYIIHICEV